MILMIMIGGILSWFMAMIVVKRLRNGRGRLKCASRAQGNRIRLRFWRSQTVFYSNPCIERPPKPASLHLSLAHSRACGNWHRTATKRFSTSGAQTHYPPNRMSTVFSWSWLQAPPRNSRLSPLPVPRCRRRSSLCHSDCAAAVIAQGEPKSPWRLGSESPISPLSGSWTLPATTEQGNRSSFPRASRPSPTLTAQRASCRRPSLRPELPLRDPNRF